MTGNKGRDKQRLSSESEGTTSATGGVCEPRAWPLRGRRYPEAQIRWVYLHLSPLFDFLGLFFVPLGLPPQFSRRASFLPGSRNTCLVQVGGERKTRSFPRFLSPALQSARCKCAEICIRDERALKRALDHYCCALSRRTISEMATGSRGGHRRSSGLCGGSGERLRCGGPFH